MAVVATAAIVSLVGLAVAGPISEAIGTGAALVGAGLLSLGSTLAVLMSGVSDRGETLRAARVTPRKVSGRESHLTVELDEGKNREIRRLFVSVGHEVTRLTRIAFGPLQLGSLRPGTWRELATRSLVPSRALATREPHLPRRSIARSSVC